MSTFDQVMRDAEERSLDRSLPVVLRIARAIGDEELATWLTEAERNWKTLTSTFSSLRISWENSIGRTDKEPVAVARPWSSAAPWRSRNSLINVKFASSSTSGRP